MASLSAVVSFVAKARLATAFRRAPRFLITVVVLAGLGGGQLARAVEPGLQPLPPPARPWLNEPVLMDKVGPEFAGQLGRIYRELAAWPADQDVSRLFASLAEARCVDAQRLDAEHQLLEARRRAKEEDWGLNFEAGGRFDPDTGNVDSGGHSLYAGLSWDYYRDGMWSNRLQAETLRLEKDLLHLRNAQSESRMHLGCRHSRLIASFNALKLRLLGEREKLLLALHQLYRQAYFLGFVNLDEVILVERDLERTRHLVSGFQSFNLRSGGEGGGSALKGEPPLLDVRLEALVAAVKADPAYQTIAKLEREIVDQRYDRRHDKRLRFYVYPRLKWDNDFNSGADLVAGVGFSMPLTDDRNAVRDAERALPAMRQLEAQVKDADEILRLYYEYKYRLDDAIKLHYQRALILERLRRAFIEGDLPMGQRSYLPEVLQGVRDLLDTQLEILDIKQNLYVRLLHLFSQSNQGYRADFISVVQEEKNLVRGRPGERALYVWSEEFNRFSNPVLVHLLKTKAFTNVVVSAGKKTQADKLAAFIPLADTAGIRVELMLSDNESVKPGNVAKVAAQAERLFALAPHLHLDVEPHALPDFKTKRAAYVQQFGQLLEHLAKLRRPGQSLSVALPTLLQPAEVRSLSGHVDRVYVMAYGSNKPDVILRRLEPFMSIPPERLVLALRPSDFAGELELEEFIQELVRRGPIRQFALHDLAQFQSMIERSQ